MSKKVVFAYTKTVKLRIRGGIGKGSKGRLGGFSRFVCVLLIAQHQGYGVYRHAEFFSCKSELFLGGCLDADAIKVDF